MLPMTIIILASPPYCTSTPPPPPHRTRASCTFSYKQYNTLLSFYFQLKILKLTNEILRYHTFHPSFLLFYVQQSTPYCLSDVLRNDYDLYRMIKRNTVTIFLDASSLVFRLLERHEANKPNGLYYKLKPKNEAE